MLPTKPMGVVVAQNHPVGAAVLRRTAARLWGVLCLDQSQPHYHQTDRNQHEQQYVSHTRAVCSRPATACCHRRLDDGSRAQPTPVPKFLPRGYVDDECVSVARWVNQPCRRGQAQRNRASRATILRNRRIRVELAANTAATITPPTPRSKRPALRWTVLAIFAV
jgi:hypothetical protein